MSGPRSEPSSSTTSLSSSGLKKVPPLDTEIVGVAVEIKGTVRDATAPWMIPREGQCQVTILIRIDPKANRFAAWLMRTHRAWLSGGKGNQDLKRSPLVDAVQGVRTSSWLPWTDLPPQPLALLTHDQVEVVFGTARPREAGDGSLHVPS